MKTEIQHNKQNLNQDSPIVMSWSLKAIDQSPIIRKIVILTCLAPTVIIMIAAFWSLHTGEQEDHERRISFIPATLIIGSIFIAICRQKTVFNYRLYAEHGEYEFCHYFPVYAEKLFQGFVIIAVLLLISVAIYTTSWLILLIGPPAIIIGSARTLLGWERPVPEHRKTQPWLTHEFVTVDRKHRIIVIHCTDPTTGFVARFPNKTLLDQYLAFLKTVLSPQAEFTEKVWEW